MAFRPSSTIDRDTAARFGITPATVDNALYNAFGQRIVSTIFTQSNQYRVILEADPVQQQSLGLAGLDLPAVLDRGERPGAAVGDRQDREQTAPLQINHLGQFPSTTSRSTCARRLARRGGRRDPRRPNRNRAAGQRHHQLPGRGAGFQASLGNELLLILAAIVTVYIVLGVLYESFIHPITILSTLPSAGVGALLALMIAGSDLGVIGIIGIILLIGIVKKNAIMMIDFALDAERSEGKRRARRSTRRACCASARS